MFRGIGVGVGVGAESRKSLGMRISCLWTQLRALWSSFVHFLCKEFVVFTSQDKSSFQSIMSPVLQALITLTVRIPLRFLFLCKMTLTVCHYTSHVIDIIYPFYQTSHRTELLPLMPSIHTLIILLRIFLRIFLQNLNDLTSTTEPSALSRISSGRRGEVPVMPNRLT